MSVQVTSPAFTPRPPGGGMNSGRFPSSDQQHYRHQFHRSHYSSGGGGRGQFRHHYQPYHRPFPRPQVLQPSSAIGGGSAGSTPGSSQGTPASAGDNPNEYDGRRLRKSLVRKTVDYNAAIIKGLQNRVWQRDHRDRRALEPDYSYAPDTVPPSMLLDNSSNAVTTRYVKSATNKMRCPIFSMAWTPEGRRLVTGASSGEFTLWNGLTFNFETILQAHDSPVRSMVWSHNDVWMVTGDHAGYVKYWQSNMNNVKMFQAHKEAVRGLSFSPSDQKFASCSDDGTVRIWDFYTCYEEKILRGHGADVKCVDWHPHKGIIVSGSKDNQQPVKIWDPKSGTPLATLHAHKSTVMDARWNKNGNWLITASRDHLVKIFDIRKLSQEFQVFRGHKKEASCLSWHPIHENLFVSGGSDGSILFWNVGCDKEVGSIENAHDNIIWSLAWHPVGHILCSGSNDHTSKFWTRQKPGDVIRDKHPGAFHDYGAMDDNEMEEVFIPGMGPEDKVETNEVEKEEEEPVIPGLDITEAERTTKLEKQASKKTPYQKPIPKKFQAIWNDSKVDDELEDDRGERVFFGDRMEPPPRQQMLPPRNRRVPEPTPLLRQGELDPFNPNVGFGPMGAQYLGGFDDRRRSAGNDDDLEYMDQSANPFWGPNSQPPPRKMNNIPRDKRQGGGGGGGRGGPGERRRGEGGGGGGGMRRTRGRGGGGGGGGSWNR